MAILILGARAYAAGPDVCTLTRLHPESVTNATAAAQKNILDRLDQTALNRKRWELPHFLNSGQAGVREFNETILEAKDSRFEVLGVFVKACFFDRLKEAVGSEASLSDLSATLNGLEFQAEMNRHIAGLESKQVSEAEIRTCYSEKNPDRRDACWEKVSIRVLETVFVPQVLRSIMAKAASEQSLRQGVNRVSRLETLEYLESRAKIQEFHALEKRSQQDEDNSVFRVGHR